MRSSKSRSRSKSNRNRSMGNVVNRVFDSSGPEGKVRGTPQQIIDKYNQLARDAQLSNDRVAAENFQQHAEHYLRMLAEAQREQAERQAQQQQQQQDRQQRNQNTNDNTQNQGGQNSGNDKSDGTGDQPRVEAANSQGEQPKAKSDDVIDISTGDESSPLVETPENAAPKPRRNRRKPAPEAEASNNPESTTPDAAE